MEAYIASTPLSRPGERKMAYAVLHVLTGELGIFALVDDNPGTERQVYVVDVPEDVCAVLEHHHVDAIECRYPASPRLVPHALREDLNPTK